MIPMPWQRLWAMRFVVTLLAGLCLSLCLAPRAQAGSYEDFFSAIERDDARGVTALLARGFDPNSHGPDGQPGLLLALQKESFRAAGVLLGAKHLNVDLVNGAGETPLMLAALKGQLDCVRQLLALGAQVNQPGWNALHYAAAGPEPQVVALLLSHGALVDAESPNGTTALMMAARYGEEPSVRLLTGRQADGRKKNQQGLDAAAFARASGRDYLAKALAQRYP
jgi:ankyrin repeat protein